MRRSSGAGDYFGPALNRAARLRSLAGAGRCCAQAVAELVRDHLPKSRACADLGHRDLRGLSRRRERVPAPPAAAPDASRRPARRGADAAGFVPPTLLAGTSGPFVGRGDELAVLAGLVGASRGG